MISFLVKNRQHERSRRGNMALLETANWTSVSFLIDERNGFWYILVGKSQVEYRLVEEHLLHNKIDLGLY
jgi:hypothetical protein